MRQNIKNYTSEQKPETSSINIQKILSRAGAKSIILDYDDNGELIGVGFLIKTSKGDIPIKLPSRVEKVGKVMYCKSWEQLNEDEKDQCKRTAWRNIQDWIDAQCAMIETEMVKLEEIFLPYMTTPSGDTFFESMEDKGFLLPKPGEGVVE